MPWSTPSLREIRSLVRDNIRASLPGADASVPNSVLRVLSDAQGALAHLNLQYIDWLALQLLPDTAETEWLDRHGAIWLVNSDGTIGRKQATFAEGVVAFTGTEGTVIPVGARLTGTDEMNYEVTAETTVSLAATETTARALSAGALGNRATGDILDLNETIPGVDNTVTVVEMTGGVDVENDDDLRARVLHRIRQPPMGGAAHDYINWALAVPGVTRAWCYPLEMGIGTVTVRFMMDELRSYNSGFPLQQDIDDVAAYLDIMRPVAVKDIFVMSPIPHPVHVTVDNLLPGGLSVQAEIEKSLEDMLLRLATPGQTIFAAWKSSAIMNTPNVTSFHLVNAEDDIMPAPGYMAVLGNLMFL